MNKFWTTQTFQEKIFINQSCLRITPKDNTLPHLFYTCKDFARKKYVFENTFGDTFTFVAQDIHSNTCLPHFKLSTNPTQIVGLHTNISLKWNMLVGLCVGTYITSNGLINGANKTFQSYLKNYQNH